MNQDLIARAIQAVMPAVRESGLLVSLATFQLPDGLTDGGFVSSNYADIAGLVDIPCMVAPFGTSDTISNTNEQKGQEEQESKREFHAILDNYYPAAETAWRDGARIVIDGNPWDVIGVEFDSQHQMTRVRISNTTI